MRLAILLSVLALLLTVPELNVIAGSPPPKAKTASLSADDGAVAQTGKVVKDGSGLKVDFLAYKHGTGLDIKAGRKGTSHLPLHKFKKKDKYASVKDVPCVKPLDSEKNAYLSLPEPGRGFTFVGNKSSGYYRAVVKALKDGKMTVEFEKCPE
jgi:hypothetical protein